MLLTFPGSAFGARLLIVGCERIPPSEPKWPGSREWRAQFGRRELTECSLVAIRSVPGALAGQASTSAGCKRNETRTLRTQLFISLRYIHLAKTQTQHFRYGMLDAYHMNTIWTVGLQCKTMSYLGASECLLLNVKNLKET